MPSITGAPGGQPQTSYHEKDLFGVAKPRRSCNHKGKGPKTACLDFLGKPIISIFDIPPHIRPKVTPFMFVLLSLLLHFTIINHQLSITNHQSSTIPTSISSTFPLPNPGGAVSGRFLFWWKNLKRGESGKQFYVQQGAGWRLGAIPMAFRFLPIKKAFR